MWRCKCLGCETSHNVRAAPIAKGISHQCNDCRKGKIPPPPTGTIFNRWKFLEEIENRPEVKWKCLCLGCNKIRIRGGRSVRSGHSKQCRTCQVKIAIKNRKFKSRFDLFGNDKKIQERWRDCLRHIISRCENPNDPAFYNYGRRGIKISEELKIPENFCKLIISLDGWNNKKLSLDRVDNNGDYAPGNLRMATMSQQVKNRRPKSEWRRP